MISTSLVLKRIAASPLLCCALLTASAGRLDAQTQATPMHSASTLTVRVTGIRNTRGNISIALYRDSKWVENREAEIDANSLSATAVFEKLPQGVYAVNLYHDQNMNGKMDTNFLGAPVEGYGFSNNPRKRMSKPGFDETSFPVNEPECAIEVRMIYWR